MEERITAWVLLALAAAILLALLLWYLIQQWTSAQRLKKVISDRAKPVAEGSLRDFTDEQWRDLINKRRAAKAQVHTGRSRYLMDNPPSGSAEGSLEADNGLRASLLQPGSESGSLDHDHAAHTQREPPV